jgi:hypothetical protein
MPNRHCVRNPKISRCKIHTRQNQNSHKYTFRMLNRRMTSPHVSGDRVEGFHHRCVQDEDLFGDSPEAGPTQRRRGQCRVSSGASPFVSFRCYGLFLAVFRGNCHSCVLVWKLCMLRTPCLDNLESWQRAGFLAAPQVVACAD